jgi:hypothetical protein
MPSEYITFFTATATASATLVGLLFVALSIDVGLEHEYRSKQFALTETAFISLGGVFIISLFALLPADFRITIGAGILLAVIGLADLARIERLSSHVHYPRDLWYIFVTVAVYVCLAGCSVLLIRQGVSATLLNLFCSLLAVLSAVSLVRAWRALLITKHKPSST